MTINATRVSAGEALGILKAGWDAQAAGQMRTAWMLHGRPGVGKTQVVQQLAQQIGADLIDLRLTTIEPQDLRGLPYYDHEAGKTVWYRPEDLPDQDRPTVLFLDELTAAAPHLQPTVYGLLQERRVGRHMLPDQVFLVAAGNTVEDGAIAYEMGTGLSDRMIHLMVEAVPGDWLDAYAVPRGLHPAVIAFIKNRPDLLDSSDRDLAAGHVIMATPRTWERASEILVAVSNRVQRNAMLAGTLGAAIAAEFAVVADDIAATVKLEALLAASGGQRAALYPETLHGLYALVYGLAGAVSADQIRPVLEVLAGIGDLAQTRPEPVFQRLPLAELVTYGFELVLTRALDQNLGDAVLETPAYQRYAEARAAAGLA